MSNSMQRRNHPRAVPCMSSISLIRPSQRKLCQTFLRLLHILRHLGALVKDRTVPIGAQHFLRQTALTALALRPEHMELLRLLPDHGHLLHVQLALLRLTLSAHRLSLVRLLQNALAANARLLLHSKLEHGAPRGLGNLDGPGVVSVEDGLHSFGPQNRLKDARQRLLELVIEIILPM